MTKARQPMTFADAVLRVADRLGWDACAELLDIDPRQVRRYSEPDVPTLPALEDALRLDAAYLEAGGGDPPILAVYQRLLGRALTPPADAETLARSVARTAVESGEATAALVLATRPGATDLDRALAAREGREAVEALTSAIDQLGGQRVDPPPEPPA